MTKNTIAAVLLSLIVGAGIGYFIRDWQAQQEDVHNTQCSTRSIRNTGANNFG